MKAKYVNKIFKPKTQDQIFADLLETEESNIPVLNQMYDEWNNIVTNSKGESKLKALYGSLPKYEKLMPDPKSAGLLGLRRMLDGWKNKRSSWEIVTETVLDWLGWYYDAKRRLDDHQHYVNMR